MNALRQLRFPHLLIHLAAIRPRGVVEDVERSGATLDREREVDDEIKVDDRPLLGLDLLPVRDDVRHRVAPEAV